MTDNDNTWTTDSGKQFPLFAFDEPCVVALPNGTQHQFKLWNETIEKRREDLLKTVIVTSPALVNGENPQDVRTDFTRSALYYYSEMIDKISGVQYNGNSPDEWINANQETHETIQDSTSEKHPDGVKARVKDLLSVTVRKAAALRLYGGRMEVEKPDDKEQESYGDPFSDDDDNITEQIEQQEKRKEIYQLTLRREIVVKQELGVEAIGDTGRFSEPTHLIRYHFREPQGEHFSKWELHGHRGYRIPLKKGGSKAEQFYNLEAVNSLFNSLIERIDGASVHGVPVNLTGDTDDSGRKNLLALIPLPIKKLCVALIFNEMNSLGNV